MSPSSITGPSVIPRCRSGHHWTCAQYLFREEQSPFRKQESHRLQDCLRFQEVLSAWPPLSAGSISEHSHPQGCWHSPVTCQNWAWQGRYRDGGHTTAKGPGHSTKYLQSCCISRTWGAVEIFKGSIWSYVSLNRLLCEQMGREMWAQSLLQSSGWEMVAEVMLDVHELCANQGVRVEGTTRGANQDGDMSVCISYGLVTWPHGPLGLYPKSDGNPWLDLKEGNWHDQS